MPIRIEIVSPEKRFVDRDVDMAVIPGMEGDIAAMPERAPLMLQLRGGVVSLYENNAVAERYFVSGGFADMTAERCTVLADSVSLLGEISADEARQRLHELEEQWSRVGPDDITLGDQLGRELQSVRAMLEASESNP